jgi:Flp pilus assembly protein TadG
MSLRALLACRRGGPVVEVALAFPLLLVVVGNLVDYGLMLRRNAQLANGVSNAAQYAALKGAEVSVTTLQSIANSSSWLTGATASATAAACYCPSGSPRITLGTAVACTATCDSGQVAQKYVTVTASYAFSPTMPGVTGLGARTLTASATVMVR